MINPLNAACDAGFVPTDLYYVETPAVEDTLARAIEISETIIDEYDADAPDVHITELDSDREFDRIYAHFTAAIDEVTDRDGEVAVDITPGRKYMSAIAFATGLRHDVDHVFHFYVQDTSFHGQSYPDIPATATTLYDFTEVL